MEKPVPATKKTVEVSVSGSPDLIVPRLCNLVNALYSKERGEVILDFVYFDERIKKDDNVLGHQVAKVAMTSKTAQSLMSLLGKFLKEQ